MNQSIRFEDRELFLKDNVPKEYQIRVVGGMQVIATNAEISQESVKITESLCSADDLKFGLSEGRCLEFSTTIKIENKERIYLYEREKDLPNSKYNFLGEYIVSSCVKNNRIKSLYDVVSYSNNDANSVVGLDTDLEQWKSNQRASNKITYTKNVCGFAPGIVDEITGSMTSALTMKDGLVEFAPFGPFDQQNVEFVIWSTNPLASGYSFKASFSYIDIGSDQFGANTKLVLNNPVYTAIVEDALAEISTHYIGDEVGYIQDGHIIVQFNLFAQMFLKYLSPFIYHAFFYTDATNNNSLVYEEAYPLTDWNEEFYVYGGGENKKNGKITEIYRLIIPQWIDVRDQSIYSVRYNVNPYPLSSQATKIDFQTVPNPFVLKEKKTIVNEYQSGDYQYYYYAEPSKDFTKQNFLSSYSELQAKFGKISNFGNYENIEINTKNPITLADNNVYPADSWVLDGLTYSMDMYSGLEVSEYEVQKYGYIRVDFLNENNEKNVVTLKIGNGKNVYDMTNNFLLISFNRSYSQVVDLINNYFKDNLLAIESYTPLSLEARGLPYVSIGDRINIETKGKKYQTYVMKRTLSGGQVLKDLIETIGNARNPNSDEWISKVGIIESEV